MNTLLLAVKLVAEIVLIGVALGLILVIAGLVAGYVMLGFFYLTA